LTGRYRWTDGASKLRAVQATRSPASTGASLRTDQDDHPPSYRRDLHIHMITGTVKPSWTARSALTRQYTVNHPSAKHFRNALVTRMPHARIISPSPLPVGEFRGGEGVALFAMARRRRNCVTTAAGMAQCLPLLNGPPPIRSAPSAKYRPRRDISNSPVTVNG